jgi:hypothetical protein
MRAIVRGILVITALLVLTFVVDDLTVRYRQSRGADALDEVSIYLGTRLKNRTIEIFYDRPVTETCVRALFPHLGHTPCWYLRRHPVKLVRAPLSPLVRWPSTSA